MIRTIDIDINAANPNLPLAPFQAFVTSPSSVRIRNVPRKIGAWELTSVSLVVNYPDNTLRTAVCKLTAGVWVGTVVGSASVGSSVNGYAIIASGTDENGNGITGYILGKGDVIILSTDGTITIGETTYYVHLVDTLPASPKKGDICKIGGIYKLYNGSVWDTLGGGSSTVDWSDIQNKPTSFTPSAHASSHGSTGTDPITPAAIGAVPVSESISDIPENYTMADIKTKVNEIIHIIAQRAALAVMLLWSFSVFASASITPQTSRLDTLPNSALVVTNVTASEIYTTAEADSAIDAAIVAATNTVGSETIVRGELDSLGYYDIKTTIASIAYVSIEANAADFALRAGGDASGNDIDATYATKTELADKVDAPSATNAAVAVVTPLLDYALTNLTGTSVTLASGQIGAATVSANLALALDFSASPDRSGDCLLYVYNSDGAADHYITPTNDYHYVSSDLAAALKLAKATTNIVMFSRLKSDTVLVSKQEVK